MSDLMLDEPAPAADQSNNKWHMAGTEGTGKYLVIADGPQGRLGIRVLGGGRIRVRIEPSSQMAASALAEHFPLVEGWKQPWDDQFRFSTVVNADSFGIKVVERALRKLRLPDELPLQRNPKGRYWRKNFSQPSNLG